MSRRSLLLALVLLVPASPAYAHAKLMSTTPAAGQAVAAPAAVTFRFDDIVQLPPGALRITGPGGAAVPVRTAQPDSKTLQGLFARKLTGGRYAAHWRIVADDGHTVSGTLRFAVRAGAQKAAAPAVHTMSPPSHGSGSAGVILTLVLSVITIVALGVGLVRIRKERAVEKV